jgi:hypothetical protein
MTRGLWLAMVATVFGSMGGPESVFAQGTFPHEVHSAFFSDCTACHSGVMSGEEAGLYPEVSTCAACHDGNSAPAIKWEAPDTRASSLAFTHAPHDFGCTTCHFQEVAEGEDPLAYPPPETCLTCHAPGTEHSVADCGFCHAKVSSFPLTRDGFGEPFHGPDFSSNHGAAASAGQPECSSCHTENSCTQCHDGMPSPDFHSMNFVLSHGPEAYGRVSDCTTCHNSEGFCRECHLNLGMEGGGGFVAPFHDNQAVWVLSHPQAARQDLESCVSCHQQNDCMRFHSAAAGMRISPHGPGFDGASMQSRNKAMCTLCHLPGSSGGGG